MIRPKRHTVINSWLSNWRKIITPGQLLIMLVLLLVFVAAAYPFFYVLSLAFMPYENYVAKPIHYGPSGFTLLYFQEIFRDPRLIGAFQISVLRTLIGTTLNVVATMMAGYALSRPNLKYGRYLTFLFLVPMFFGGGLIPYFLTVRAVGLLNTFWALVIPNLVSPFFLFIVRSYFLSYPQEIIEAATMDGASQFGIFWRVVWPTSMPMIATIALLYGTGHWNEYFWSGILVQPGLQPAPVLLNSIMNNRSMLQGLGLGTQLTPQSFIAAVSATLIIPVLVVYPFLQRYVVKGILVGSIKG
ncbi:MAG TPA: carbohydrate ABC transporter permease [Spirillospora sp.]|nr:carbohydrate ABC transporter permease [Spirillospora sp.]